ncbi:MAG: exodeoxyribonuclease V subunit gamma [Leptospirales bacterium]
MIVLHISNQMERLTEHLLDEIGAAPPAPWDSLMILPQNPTLGRWLSFRIADRLGVSMNVDTPLPGVWVRDFLEMVCSPTAGGFHFDRTTLFVRLLEILPSLKDHPDFSAIRTYLESGVFPQRLVGLADQLSEVFDRAMLYRPEVLVGWEENPCEGDWLCQLWRALTRETRPPHLARLLQNFLLHPDSIGEWKGVLPSRLFLFGLSGMSPSTFGVFRKIGMETSCQVHVFFLNPTEKYWADMVSLRSWQTMDEDLKPYFDPGHPLLATLGKTARDLHRVIESWVSDERFAGAIEVREDFCDPGTETVLSRLQGGIFRMESSTVEGEAKDDGSLLVVSAPSPMREVETLRDFLLERLSSDPFLTLEEIVVLAPDIETYSGAVRTVFGAPFAENREDPSFLPFTLSDRGAFSGSPFQRVLRSLILLPGECFNVSDLVRLLSLEEVRNRFGIDLRTSSSLEETVIRGGFRWGLDEEDRKETVGDRTLHTFSWLMERLLLGYCTGEGDGEDTPLPLVLSNDPQGEKTGLLYQLFDLLTRWRETLSQPRALTDWSGLLEELLSDFFELDSDRHRDLLSIGEEIRKLSQQAGENPVVTCEMFWEILSRRFFLRTWRDRFFSGGITFGRMVPLRSIPFRVICLLGMDEGAFPRNDAIQSFDFLRKDPRPLDRSVREDDLHLFLEILLSSRSALWISYAGVSAEDGTSRPPSVLVRQLLETVGASPDPGGPDSLHKTVPGDPFDPFLFTEAAGALRSHSERWASIARKRIDPAKRMDPFLPADGRLVLPKKEKGNDAGTEPLIPLVDFLSFFRNPPRYQAREILGLASAGRHFVPSEQEPFVLPRGNGEDPFSKKTEDPALLPWSPMGPIWLEKSLREARERIEMLEPVSPGISEDTRENLPFLIRIGRRRIFGTAPLLMTSGMVVVDRSPWKVDAADLLVAWLSHLVFSEALSGYSGTIVLDWSKDSGSRKKTSPPPLVWKKKSEHQAGTLLRTYLSIYLKGKKRILAFTPSISMEWAYGKRFGGGDDSSLLSRVVKVWKDAFPGARNERSNRMTRSDPRRKPDFFPSLFFDKEGEWLSQKEFPVLSERVFGSLLDHLPPPERKRRR